MTYYMNLSKRLNCLYWGGVSLYVFGSPISVSGFSVYTEGGQQSADPHTLEHLSPSGCFHHFVCPREWYVQSGTDFADWILVMWSVHLFAGLFIYLFSVMYLVLYMYFHMASDFNCYCRLCVIDTWFAFVWRFFFCLFLPAICITQLQREK